MNGIVLESYDYQEINAPFKVLLISSVSCEKTGKTIPNEDSLIRSIAIARLWCEQRISASELKFLRKIAKIDVARMAKAIGVTSEDVEAYETGPRPMTVGLEKCIRLCLFNVLRRQDASRNRLEEMVNYIEWTLEEWEITFLEISYPIVLKMKYYPTGWQDVSDKFVHGKF